MAPQKFQCGLYRLKNVSNSVHGFDPLHTSIITCFGLNESLKTNN